MRMTLDGLVVGALTSVLFTLKICWFHDWSWWIVFSPFWIPFAAMLILAVFVVLGLASIGELGVITHS